jgi:two-component system NtrC family sensor kinase
MLTFVRQPGEGKSRLIVHDLIDKTLALIGHQGRLRDIQVIRDFGEDVTGVWANEGGVRQVLLALIINALDAMEDKGTLTIATAPEEEKKIQITIRDSGPGIPPESLPRIFDLFFTTKSSRGGTGLGLAIAHEIVRENQGEIRVVSPPGEGAIFTVILPTA